MTADNFNLLIAGAAGICAVSMIYGFISLLLYLFTEKTVRNKYLPFPEKFRPLLFQIDNAMFESYLLTLSQQPITKTRKTMDFNKPSSFCETKQPEPSKLEKAANVALAELTMSGCGDSQRVHRVRDYIEELKAERDGLMTKAYLQRKYPEMTEDTLDKYYVYLREKTMLSKECYGDGKEMLWSYVNELVRRLANKRGL